ncbi:MAG: S9 family peptidase [Bacteroidetes bacterium HGW-Bacteroidetes-6]|jgi:dipeptidyl-peptidase-4|nr:MAG: S9 family peptidase [Bacteroidetes bacterium HGW-Bacteroidetes-6]
MKVLFVRLFLVVLISWVVVPHQAYSQKDISIADIWATYVFYPKSITDIQNYPDGKSYTVLEKNSIVLYSFKDGEEVKSLVAGSEMKWEGSSITIDEYSFNSDASLLIVGTDVEGIYRHSVKGNYFVYNMSTKALVKIPGEGNVRLPDFSPDGKKVAYVRDNNLYVMDIASAKETAITTDGEWNKIIYGTTDWVYEEEFGFTKGFSWSPDGKYIAYYRMDESGVKEFTLTYHGELYPEEYKYKYPKAGEDNSLVDIYMYDVAVGKSVKMDVGSVTDQYIPRIEWTYQPGKLAILRLNRLQNHLDILLTDASTGKSTVMYSEENKCYVDITDNTTFLKDGTGFVFTSEKAGYNQIYYFDMTGKLIKQLTTGDFDISTVLGIDEKNRVVYFTSFEDGPMNIMLYSVNLDGSKKQKITKEIGTHGISFSADFSYYIDNFSDANTAPKYTICDNTGKALVVLEDNASLNEKMTEYGFTKKEFFSFKTTEDVELNGWMIKPANMEAGKKYPVLMYMYGGPGVNTVENSFGYFDFAWFEMLAQKGYIVVSVDNRGTGGRGEEFKKCTYLQLGKYEVQDQIEAAKYLGSLDYVDKSRIGAFGWSFGGYLSTLCMTKGADYFKAGIAVAPVTNWRYYDNIYTERFMRTPQENADGYDKNSPINFVKKLKGKYFLVHGTTDDNVHVQNSMDLISALVNANKDFEMFMYPNKNHGIYGGYTRYHLYNKMTNFLLENL